MADTTDDLKHPPQEQVSCLIIEVTYIRDFFRNEKTTKNEACEIEASVTVKNIGPLLDSNSVLLRPP